MWWRRIFGFSQAEGGQSEAAPSVGNPSDIDSDSPIRTPDEDRFGVDHFAQLIAKSVAAQAGAEGTVIAITAPWGGGKSSVVNLTEYHLQQEHAEVLIIRFNPWWFTGSDALAQAFMSTLASALDRSLGDRGEEAVRAFLARMTRIETYKRAAVKAAEDGWARGTAALLFGNRTVEEEHAALSRALAQQSQHIVIVIDDIDRLSPDESLLIFGLLKSVGRLPNVTYLLAFDRLLVERLLLERYPSEGAQYLEKILQATFDLPPVASDVLRSMVEDELGSMFQIPEGDAVEFLNLFHDVVVPKLTSARQAKRYLGSLKVT
jgi:predicted KAP-like P-loop ATPase